MRVFIRSDYDSLSLTSANFVADVINNIGDGKMVNIAFPSGRTVEGTYKVLGNMVKEGKVSVVGRWGGGGGGGGGGGCY